MNENAARPRDRGLWNPNFILLWQGQLVSALGDIVYAIALGFWILAVTGSTALMGTLMAVSTLPRVLVAPFAGVLVDRSDRKWLLVAMDIVRGVFVVFIGIGAYAGFIQVWMVFAAGVIIGFCGAFFTPAVSSSIPDIVPREKIIQANSAYNLIYTSSGILGSSAGGFLFQILGAPLMFLLNGLSYLFSSLSLLFIRIPRIVPKREPQHFFADLKDGLTLSWKMRGLRLLLLVAAVLNFFSVMGVFFILPLFQKTPSLGPARYGIAIACFSIGSFIGYLTSASVKFAPSSRFGIFMSSFVIMDVGLILFALIGVFPIMLGFLAVSGGASAIINSFTSATIQMVVPQDMRGKVFAFLSALSQGLTPIAMALGGLLAGLFPLRPLMAACFMLVLACSVPLFFSFSFRKFINFDPTKDTVESLSS